MPASASVPAPDRHHCHASNPADNVKSYLSKYFDFPCQWTGGGEVSAHDWKQADSCHYCHVGSSAWMAGTRRGVIDLRMAGSLQAHQVGVAGGSRRCGPNTKRISASTPLRACSTKRCSRNEGSIEPSFRCTLYCSTSVLAVVRQKTNAANPR